MEVKLSGIASIATFLTVLLLTSGLVDAQTPVACPANISVEQKAAAPNDWSVDYSKAPAALSSATIFDGPPEEQASLKYDDERSAKTEIIQTWQLPASERGYWIVCGYANTTAQLRRKLPDDIRGCEVALEKGVTFGDGAAVLKRAECTSISATSHKAVH
jgi:hypothetical protein